MTMRTPEQIKELQRKVNSISWWHSLDLGDGIITPGKEPNSRSRDAYMHIPWDQMEGKTVLDIGAWDGLYSFEAEKHGAAKVIALEPDPEHQQGFVLARTALNSKVGKWNGDCASFQEVTEVDVVFYFGVLYHLKNPYLDIEHISGMIRPGGLLILETAVTETDTLNWSIPILEFCEGERNGDASNWNYPNKAWVEAVLRSTGFKKIEYQGGISNRAAWHARKPIQKETESHG